MSTRYPCESCGASKNHAAHSKWHQQYHEYVSPRVGWQDKPRSKLASRSARQQAVYDDGYAEAAAEARGEPCQVVSPVCVGTAMDLHEPLARGRAGGLKAALRDGPPPITACRPCNSYIMDHQVWARERGLLVSRKDLGLDRIGE